MDPKKKTCICRIEHRFSACPYLIKSKCLQGWTANPEVQKVVDEKLKILRVKKGVERACQFIISKEKEKEQDKMSSEKVEVFMAVVNYITSTDYSL